MHDHAKSLTCLISKFVLGFCDELHFKNVPFHPGFPVPQWIYFTQPTNVCMWVFMMPVSSMWVIASSNPLNANKRVLRQETRNRNVTRMTGEAIAEASLALLLFVRIIMGSCPARSTLRMGSCPARAALRLEPCSGGDMP